MFTVIGIMFGGIAVGYLLRKVEPVSYTHLGINRKVGSFFIYNNIIYLCPKINAL